MHILHHYNCKINNSMKKVSLLLLTMLLTFGCNQKTKEQVSATQESKPQPSAIEIRNHEIQDSLKKVKNDSLALIAWGDVIFGMNMKEVLATETFKGGDKYDDSITMEFERERNLKRAFGLNNLAVFWAEFKENELYRIYIKSYYLTADNIDDIVSECDLFIRNFTEKYGVPSYKKNGVNISDFNDDEEFEYAKFQIGDKTITIALGELTNQFKFYYSIYIDNDKFPQKKHIMTEKEIKQVRKQMEETEKIRNNSF